MVACGGPAGWGSVVRVRASRPADGLGALPDGDFLRLQPEAFDPRLVLTDGALVMRGDWAAHVERVRRRHELMRRFGHGPFQREARRRCEALDDGAMHGQHRHWCPRCSTSPVSAALP